jgi:hypothetical protein
MIIWKIEKGMSLIPPLSYPNMYHLIKRAHKDANGLKDYMFLWELNLARSVIPQTYSFP